MHSGLFAPLTRVLAARFAVHLVDLPGHGRSRDDAAFDLQTILAGLIERIPDGAVWAGWSLGGMLALQAALLAPQRVKRLVLVGATPSFTQRSDWPR